MKTKKQYNTFKSTALKRKDISVPYRKLIAKGIIKEGVKILDYGCGQFDIKEQCPSLNVTGFDKFNEVYADKQVLNADYDVAVCFYVFNVIPTKEEHEATLAELRGQAKDVFVAVRADAKAINAAWEYDAENEVYDTGASWQRFYNEEMVRRFFGEVEYLTNNQSLKLFRLK